MVTGDVFVSKLDSGLNKPAVIHVWAGLVMIVCYSITFDTRRKCICDGSTSSIDFPTTSGAYNTSVNGGNWDVFVSKLNSGLTSLLASTYLGGSGIDYSYSLTLNTSGNVYVTGRLGQRTFQQPRVPMILPLMEVLMIPLYQRSTAISPPQHPQVLSSLTAMQPPY